MTKFAAAFAGLLGVAIAGPACAQDVAKGETAFRVCAPCHKIGPEAKNAVGPALTGVIGRKSGTAEGYSYSALNKAAGDSGLVWSEDLVVQYLADPNAFLKKFLADKGKADAASGATKMITKVADEQQRKDIAAYLAKFADKK